MAGRRLAEQEIHILMIKVNASCIPLHFHTQERDTTSGFVKKKSYFSHPS